MAEKRAASAASSASDSSSLPELYNPSKKVTSSKVMKRKEKSSHPSTADMVTEAIVQLADRGGSSLLAIKKYIANAFNLDVDKQSTYIKRYLKSAVAKGSLVQTTGRGANGSFKLPSAKHKAALTKSPFTVNDEASAKKSVTSMKKKSVKASAKKQTKKTGKTISSTDTSKENSSPTFTPTEPKSPSKTKKNVKSPTSKPKVPKPKKATGAKSMNVVTSKKTAVKK
ncbi:histone H1B, sperm-like [Venturia canescens]|uniref:histone H1B, sperm-like n=1 Tax=Venturia canescens TaxID=32260 RepID=UPI001C9C74EA|nr:histone H1B, sperm-like [Venturia canescens]XP_043286118.1 histone H1B, sperm-like [Venturia canescens]